MKLKLMIFVLLLSFVANADSETIDCTIKALRPKLCPSSCEDIIQKGPFKINPQSDQKEPIFEGDLEKDLIGTSINVFYEPAQRIIIAEFTRNHETKAVITNLNSPGHSTFLMYKDISLEIVVICE